MKRVVILTVGKTHSGKSTFAKALEKVLANSVVIDQDNHAEFLHTHYKTLVPKQGQNMLKHALTQSIVNYAVTETNCHLIVCNSNRSRKGRLNLLEYFHDEGFLSIVVNFNIADDILVDRVRKSQRSTKIFRFASTFEEVLARQQAETNERDVIAPVEGEADYLFEVIDPDEIETFIKEIVEIAQGDE